MCGPPKMQGATLRGPCPLAHVHGRKPLNLLRLQSTCVYAGSWRARIPFTGCNPRLAMCHVYLNMALTLWRHGCRAYPTGGPSAANIKCLPPHAGGGYESPRTATEGSGLECRLG